MNVTSATSAAKRRDVTDLIEEIIKIADTVENEKVVLAKLRIDVRKWVVETVLLKNESKRDRGGSESPISVTIGMDAAA